AAAIVPAELLQRFAESLEIGLLLNIFGERVEHADAPHLTVLRARRLRPRHSRAAEQRDELASFHVRGHSITSSARRRKDSGIFSPIALAVVRFMTNSNLVGCKTGRSAGFSPLRMRPT